MIACVAIIVAAFAGGCSRRGDHSPVREEPIVMASFYPAAYMARRLGDGLVEVACPVSGDVDPAFWMPDDATLRRFQNARLSVVNGAGYEHWTSAASLPVLRTCDLSSGLKSPLLTLKGTVHSHGAAGIHTHEGVDGHTWLDPINASEQTQTLLVAMCRAWPEHERAFAVRCDALCADLTDLDRRLQRISPAVRSVVLVATHPAYGYLARRQGWTVRDVDMPPDSPPDRRAIEELASLRVDSGSTPVVILFEKTPSDAIATWLATQGGLRSVVFDPCETEPNGHLGESDFLQVMRGNIDRLAVAVGMTVSTPENP